MAQVPLIHQWLGLCNAVICRNGMHHGACYYWKKIGKRKNYSVLKGNSHDTTKDENGFWKLKRPFPNVLSVYKKCFVQF